MTPSEVQEVLPQEPGLPPPPSHDLHADPTVCRILPQSTTPTTGAPRGPRFMTDQSSWWSDPQLVVEWVLRPRGGTKVQAGRGQVTESGVAVRQVSPQPQTPSPPFSHHSALAVPGFCPGWEVGSLVRGPPGSLGPAQSPQCGHTPTPPTGRSPRPTPVAAPPGLPSSHAQAQRRLHPRAGAVLPGLAPGWALSRVWSPSQKSPGLSCGMPARSGTQVSPLLAPRTAEGQAPRVKLLPGVVQSAEN